MSPENYKVALEALKHDLEQAKLSHKRALEKADDEEMRIANLRQSVAALSRLCGETFEDQDEFGLTDMVRMALKTWNGPPMTPPDVKSRIEQLGFTSNSENLLASIHTILKRLVAKDEVADIVVTVSGQTKTGYKWVAKR